jgi:putative transposase
MEKFQNKYRIKSARAQFWDYSQNGLYFITICTAHRECIFGDIVCMSGVSYATPSKTTKIMVLSAIGVMVFREWNKSFEIRTELFCDAFVLMPNHLHTILRIENIVVGADGSRGSDVADAADGLCGADVTGGLSGADVTGGLSGADVETHGRASLQTGPQPTGPQPTGIAYRSPKSISAFVAGFKSSATKQINEFRHTPKMPVWQPGFHDHIIRDENEYQRIYQYINDNPNKWETDKFFNPDQP